MGTPASLSAGAANAAALPGGAAAPLAAPQAAAVPLAAAANPAVGAPLKPAVKPGGTAKPVSYASFASQFTIGLADLNHLLKLANPLKYGKAFATDVFGKAYESRARGRSTASATTSPMPVPMVSMEPPTISSPTIPSTNATAKA